MGAQHGQSIGASLGGMLEGLVSNHGQSNVQSAMNNNMMGSLTSQLSQAIQCHPGIPQFARDEMCQALNDVRQSYPAEPTTPGCQQDTDNSMSGIIDKIVDKVVDQIMEKLAGGGCEGGSFKDMVRQAIEDVVREQIGGGAEDDGCSANGEGSTSGASPSGSSTDYASEAGDTSNVRDSVTTSCSEDDKKEKSNGSGSWLVALAKVMGEMTGNHLQKMMQAQDKMEASSVTDADLKGKSDDEKAQIKQEKGKDFTKAQAEFQAEAKLFAMCSEATSTVLKSIGEGLSSMARKQ
jgi:hypothetical protein